MKFSEFTESKQFNEFVAPEFGVLGSGLDPQQFQAKYGMSPAQAEIAVGNAVKLNPGYNSPAVKDAMRQYLLQNPEALSAANENIKLPTPKFRLNPGAFVRSAAGRALGAIGLIFTPSDLGDGTITPEMKLQQDFETHLSETDPAAFVEMIDSQWESLPDETKQRDKDTPKTPKPQNPKTPLFFNSNLKLE